MRPTATTDERFLTAKECAERCHVPTSAWWGIAKDSLALKRGRVVFRGRTYWLASALSRWMVSHAVASDKANPRGTWLRAGRDARKGAQVTA